MNNKYFIHYDFYNMKSQDNLILLEKFKTFIQTTDYTCGPACLKMVLEYLTKKEFDEIKLKNLCKTVPFPYGTKLKGLIDGANLIIEKFKSENLKIYSTLDSKKNNNGYTFNNFIDFKKFVINNLTNGNPIIVENVDYGGHYKVIIGYDQVTSNNEEDIIIFADPCDLNDGCIDGYNYFPAERFFYMWFDDHCLDKEERLQPFLVISKSNIEKIQ